MGNVRFVLAGGDFGRKPLSTSTFPRLINGNGSYPGAPALVQDAAFPMSNALLHDRSALLWLHPAATANIGADTVFEVDLGALRTIYAHGIHGTKLMPGGVFPTSYFFEYLPGTTTYSTAGWVNAPSVTIGFRRDDLGILATPVSARYVRFRFLNTSFSTNLGFTVASFMVATTITDLGFLYSRAAETLIIPTSVVEGYGRMPTITRTGLPQRRWLLLYDNNDLATRNIFDSLMSERNPFSYITPEDLLFECVPDVFEFTREHIWSPPDRYRFTFGMRSLP